MARLTRLERFNRDVLDILHSISPDHADTLNARGIALHWWDIVYFHYNEGRSPRWVANVLASLTLSA